MKTTRKGVRVTAVARIPHFNLSKLRVKDLTRKGQMSALSVVHVTLPPRYTHAPIEHRRTEEWFIVLKGRGQGLIGRRRVRFEPGVVVYMPPGVPHQMGTGARSMEILAVFSPPLDARRKDADIHACHPPKNRARKH